jgi:ATP/maltotriose-dependent transcriptional regulator MalT
MENLTEREIAVLKLIMLGYPNSQISKKIFISTHTVKPHYQECLALTKQLLNLKYQNWQK